MPNNTKKIEMVRQYVESATLSLQEAKLLLEELTGEHSSHEALSKAKQAGAILASTDGTKVIEGVFDGQNMIGPDGKQYSIPANYASKSKLVEGDLLKLTIATNGSFIYKQIGPVERKRLRGKLIKDQESGDFRIIAEEKSYRVLTASITYFKGSAGNDVVILVPRDKPSTWSAVENIIHENEGGADFMGALPPYPANPEVKLTPDNELPARAQQEELITAHLDAGPHVAMPTPPSVPTMPATPAPSPRPSPAAPLITPNEAASAAAPDKSASNQSSLQFDDDKDEFEEI